MPHFTSSTQSRGPIAAQRAIQFDKATAGMNIESMLIQLQANIELLFSTDIRRSGAHYSIVAGEISPEDCPIPYYQAAVFKSHAEATGPVMQGPVEPTLYKAYRGLFRYTMQDVGRRLLCGNEKEGQERGQEKEQEQGQERGKGQSVVGHKKASSVAETIDRIATQKSFRVLGIDK